MPYNDGTGPWGTGPIGLGLGPCHNEIKYSNYHRGNWMYWGKHGFFRGQRYFNYAHHYIPMVELENDPEEEKKFINKELDYIEKHKEELVKRFEELNSKKISS